MPVDDEDIVALLSSTGLVLIASVLGGFAKLFERIIIVRALSPEAWGEVSMGLAILLLGTTLATLGLGQGIPRYMSRFDDDSAKRGTWLSGLVLAASLGVGVAAVLLVSAEWIAALLFERPDAPRLLQLFVLCIPLFVLLRVAKGGIRGMENTAYKVLIELCYPLVRIGLLVGLLAAGFGVFAPGIAYVIALVVFALVGHLLLNRLIDLVGAVRMNIRELTTFSVPLMLSAILMVLLTRTDTLMVGYFRSSAEVGLYSAAYPVANGLLMVLTAIGYLYLPMASRFDADDNHEDITAIYGLTTKWALLLSFPLFLVFVLFPDDVMAIIYGATYRDASLAFLILAVGTLSSLTFGRCQETLSALGRTEYILASNAGIFAFNVALNVVLIPLYGIVGAAFASALSFFILNASIYAILRVGYGITPFSAHTRRTFLVLFGGVAPVAVVVAREVSLTLITLVPVIVVAGIATVAVVTVAGCLQSEDRVVLEAFEDYAGIRVPVIRRYLPESAPHD